MREACHYEQTDDAVRCLLCPKQCLISEGRTGFCRTRQNVAGKLYALNYAACSSYGLDPIEKKPLYHFYPGAAIFSLGTWGCNLACQFCQNWQIAQSEPETVELSPEQAVEAARKTGRGNIGIAYTYNEPSVWYEYIYDTARLARQNGLRNVLVTNGFINPGPLAELLPYIDAMNIDVKAFSEEFYQKVCAGSLADVRRTVEAAAAATHVEITCLLVPGLNDAPTEVKELSQWLGNLSPDIPLHFSRYFPNYRLTLPPTPLTTLELAYQTARRHLRYVYLGNIGEQGINTQCPVCCELVIDRQHRISRLADKHCPTCGAAIAVQGEVRF